MRQVNIILWLQDDIIQVGEWQWLVKDKKKRWGYLNLDKFIEKRFIEK